MPFRPITAAPVAATAVALIFWGISVSGDSASSNTPVHATFLAAAAAATAIAAVCWALYVRHRQENWQRECMLTVRTLAAVAARREPAKTMPLHRAL